MTPGRTTLRYGVFWLGPMQLALPIEALKEVVPMGPVSALPSECACLLGGISLRGLMMPVVDLRALLRPGVAPAATAGVVVLAHLGRWLGLAADGIVGVYDLPSDEVHAVRPTDPWASVLQAAFSRPDDGSLVSVLHPDAIVAHAHVPLLTPPEGGTGSPSSAGQPTDAQADAHTDALAFTPAGGDAHHRNARCYLEDPRHLMLLRCGGMPLAIASQAVHTTVIQPALGESQLASGYFRGMMRFDDTDIPAVALSSLCGFGPPAEDRSPQAFLVRYPGGLVAFLVDEIVDVVTADGQRIAPVPLYAHLSPGWFSGTLPPEALAHSAGPAGAAPIAPFHLVVNDAALLADDRLIALADMGQQHRHAKEKARSPASAGSADPTDAAGQVFKVPLQVLAYHAGADLATPITQVAEILPWEPDRAVATADGVGLIMSRGRPIPVHALGALLAPSRWRADEPTANVLVVDDGGHRIGFRVPRLVTIGEGRTVASVDHSAATDMVQLSVGAEDRLLRLVDLVALARGLRPAGVPA